MLSQKAKYALRALLMLAEQPDADMVMIADIAERENVPRKFLEAILVDLRNVYRAHELQSHGFTYVGVGGNAALKNCRS